MPTRLISICRQVESPATINFRDFFIRRGGWRLWNFDTAFQCSTYSLVSKGKLIFQADISAVQVCPKMWLPWDCHSVLCTAVETLFCVRDCSAAKEAFNIVYNNILWGHWLRSHAASERHSYHIHPGQGIARHITLQVILTQVHPHHNNTINQNCSLPTSPYIGLLMHNQRNTLEFTRKNWRFCRLNNT